MKQYFYIDSNNQQVGPISESALMGLMQCGAISRQTPIWTEGLEGWLPFGEVFPESGDETSMPSSASMPASEIPLKQRLLDRINRRNLIIGGAVALIAAFSFSAYFVSDGATSKETAIKKLREIGVISSELDIQGKVGSRALEDSCEQGNEEILELLLAGGVNAKQINKGKLLKMTAEKGFTKAFSLMLALPGVDVNEGNALRRAAENGHVKIVKLLLAHPDIKIDSNSFYSPLRGAVEKGHIRVVKLLLAHHGIYVNEYYKDIHATPLSLAAAGGHVEIVKLLLAQPDIDVNLVDVLAAAARGGNMEIVNLLLAQSGISVKESNALESAANGGHAEIVKLLLAQPGVDVETFSEINLGVAVEKGYTEVVKLLLPKPGIKVNEEKSSSNYSLLYVASDKGYTEIVKLLLAVPGIDVNRGNPLRQAAEKGHTKIVKLLLTHPEVEVNTEDSYSSPLYVAAREGHTEIVKLLLSHPDVEGNAASLICAAKSGYTEIVMMLLNSPEIEKNISYVNYKLGIEMGYDPNNVGLKRLRSLLENKKNRK